MTDVIPETEERNAAAGAMQRQQGDSGAIGATPGSHAPRDEVRLPDPISLPMIQYFQQPSKPSVRGAA
jgi:hypothetical protein